MNAGVPSQYRWGERTYFLEKRLAYVFSLDLHLSMRLENGGPVGRKLRVRIDSFCDDHDSVSGTYHVLDDDLVTSADGCVHEVLLARAVRVDDWILLGPGNVGELDGRLLFESNDGATIGMNYSGVMTVEGDAALLVNPARTEKRMGGTAFIAARFETSGPKYRWLTQTQLIGFGRVAAGPVVHAALRLHLRFDFYSAG